MTVQYVVKYTVLLFVCNPQSKFLLDYFKPAVIGCRPKQRYEYQHLPKNRYGNYSGQ